MLPRAGPSKETFRNRDQDCSHHTGLERVDGFNYRLIRVLPRGLEILGRDLLRVYNTYDDWLWRFRPAAPVAQSRCGRLHVACGHVYCHEYHVLHCWIGHRVQCLAVNQKRHGRQVTGRIPNAQGHWRRVRPSLCRQSKDDQGSSKPAPRFKLSCCFILGPAESLSNIHYHKAVKQFKWQ